MFEIVRVDTSAVHLHFHGNGKLDDPVLLPPNVTPQNANGGAPQPTLPVFALSPSQPTIGRKEAVLALTTILTACWNTEPGAVDITDAHAFDWQRFLANTMEHRQITALVIEKVFALREAESGPPQLAFCTTTRVLMLDPTEKTYRDTRKTALRDMSSNWRTMPVFLQAKTVDENWMWMM